MLSLCPIERVLLLFGMCGVWLSLAVPAAGKEDKRVCKAAYSAYRSGSAALKARHVHDARVQLEACIESGCAELARNCKKARAKLMAALPTVVPVVTDDSGAPRADVQVRVDGILLASRLDGTGLPVEPGVREFVFSVPSGASVARKVMVIDGWHNWPLPVSVHAVAPASEPARAAGPAPRNSESRASDAPVRGSPPSEQSEAAQAPSRGAPDPGKTPDSGASDGGKWAPPRSALPYALAGAGVLGIGLGALFTEWGRRDNQALENSCSPSCNASGLDHVRGRYIAADVSFGVGIAALGVATWLFAGSRSTEKSAGGALTRVEAHPLRSGAFASVARAF